jgi:hypothetical protein
MKKLAIAVAAVLLLGACDSIFQKFANTGAPKLQFVGDSITIQSAPDINAHYHKHHDVAIDAIGGSVTWLMTGTVAAEAALKPAAEVINLGTNDAGSIGVPWIVDGQVIMPAQTLADVLGRFDTFAAEFPATTCVVFVTVDTHNPGWAPANAQAINDHIRASFAHVADWDAAWQASYFDQPNDPHPNETGRQALLALEDTAIAGCPA